MQSHYQQQQRISFNSNNSNSNSMYSSQWQPFQQYQPFKLSSAAIATAATSQICNVLPVPSSVTDGKWNDTKETMMSPSSSPSSTFNQRYNEHISPSSVHLPTQAENINKKSSKEKPSLLLNLLFDEPIPFVNPFSPTPIDSEDDPALTFFTSTTPSPLTSTRSISSVDSPSRISSKRSLDDDEDRTSSSSISNEYKSYINKKQRVNMNMYQSERLTKETLTSIQQNNIPKNKNEEMETTSTFNTINNIIRPQPLIYSSSSRALPAPAPAPAVAFAPIKPAVLKTNANLCKNVNGEKQQQHLDEETKIEINVDTNNDESKAPITISGVLRNNTTLVLDMVTPKDSSRILPQKFHIVQSPLDGKHRILSNQFKLRTACDRCTKMKIRCIPLKPGQCEGCKKRKIDCIFSPQKKRGPVNMCQSQTPANFPLQQ